MTLTLYIGTSESTRFKPYVVGLYTSLLVLKRLGVSRTKSNYYP